MSEGAQDSIGVRATQIANQKGKEWMDQAMIVVEKTVVNLANQGLFRATIRFEESLIADKNNQTTLLKRLARENLHGSFKTEGEVVELIVEWGNEYN
eukprot:CAMPEP_0201487082 /NCGR_PEP_ID=MMETSP0151_2-20130828/11083_1 /ASSEMBLY_ACC=CAM_ASM_000257 /TAXON_ID=200890 /ORGANISM="Paramoeba atlantica, Strain 621/1 / CCAP 1560/9" /LENGTH=96 /DNA_ID=CAMNT_0047872019 /DNA_START=35 /DNA_END=325 /DNA_ORIENTATION=+